MEFDDALSDQIAAALAQLADGCRNAADVAARLAGAGCRGERGSCDCCPVAGWLAARITIPAGTMICAGIDNAEILSGPHRGPPVAEMVIASAPVPQVIASFIVAFDDEFLYAHLATPAGSTSS